MPMYSPAYINYYADRYVAYRLKAHGVNLEHYLRMPERYEHLALEPEPLLPAQRAVQARLDAEWETERHERAVENLPRRNGAVVEHLHHKRRHKRSHAAFFVRRSRTHEGA
jgi:hypothetical protein